MHINIFPQDFETEWLLDVLEPLLDLPSRFSIVLEIVESDCLPLEQTHDTIETLRHRGVLTFIDDFGTGYSNIEYLGRLAVGGVKLDRVFGQAQEGSLMAELLTNAAKMIRKSGFRLIIEGVETPERADFVKDSGLFEEAQGYHFSRPLAFEDLVRFLDGSDPGQKESVGAERDRHAGGTFGSASTLENSGIRKVYAAG